MTEENTRTSALAEKHKILGSGLEDWNGMGTAWTYNTDPDKEHDAIRESAGMIDMSGLKKIRISGKDALDVLNYSFSRELSNLQVGNSSYGIVLNDKGLVADDAIVYVNENERVFISLSQLVPISSIIIIKTSFFNIKFRISLLKRHFL